ncbi:MAG: hypothetical protein AAGH89_08755 [Verrucomicrobiota bacterium]
MAKDRELLIVIGAEGSLEFAVPFAEAATQWAQAAESAGDIETTLIDSRKQLEAEIRGQLEAKPEELWIVLIGHGTFDGRTAKFNLEGEDVSATELGEWFKEWNSGELIFINTASASAPFLPALKGPNRTVITATKSGAEVNFTRFGNYLAKSLHSNLADANKDGQISVLEAFLLAASHTAEFYEKERRLATEQALIDDNGDGKGIRADWFDGLRVAKKVGEEAIPDGQRSRNLHLVPGELDRQLSAEARARRNELELKAENLRENRAKMTEADYYEQLEQIFVEIAEIYGEVGS